ncbi:hypothetical protein BU16DRAFT_520923 [Lophium mytilinum]|uniref:Uncharacterized protein n=1 Tax=Lophium mytilinum TaxID=390894 RepID=A0A6A6RAZ7_9PEZI|nr:hypothetical protein BU16DRAFT_520923 [Lophium mytilinum]
MDPPIRAILRGLYPHTALTSFITASKVYAPFARWTFKDDRSYRFGLNGRINSIAFQAGVEIISQTGRELWDVEEGPKGPSYYDPEDWADYVAWPTTRRSLSDSETWSMDLNMTNVASSQQADDVADSTSFVVCTADHERLEHGFYHVF